MAGDLDREPFVAGEAALVASEYPSLKPSDITGAITQGTAKSHQVNVGHGSIDIVAALHAAQRKAPPSDK